MIDATIDISSLENIASIDSGVNPPVDLTAHTKPATSTKTNKPTNVKATIGLTEALRVFTQGDASATSLASCVYNASRS